MKKLTAPAALTVVPLVFGCSSAATVDAGRDALADLAEVVDVFDAPDVSDIADAGADIAAEADGPALVCEARRGADGGVMCHEENVQGSGLFCIQYRCDADDGGVSLDECCRLVG